MSVADQRWRPLLAASMERRPLVVGQRLRRADQLRHRRAVQVEQRLFVHPEARTTLQRFQGGDLERRRSLYTVVVVYFSKPLLRARSAPRSSSGTSRKTRRPPCVAAYCPTVFEELLGDAGLTAGRQQMLHVPDQAAAAGSRDDQAVDAALRRETQIRSHAIPRVCQKAVRSARWPASGWTRGQVWRSALRCPSRRKNMATPTRSGRRSTRIIGESSRSTGLPQIVQDGTRPGACSPLREWAPAGMAPIIGGVTQLETRLAARSALNGRPSRRPPIRDPLLAAGAVLRAAVLDRAPAAGPPRPRRPTSGGAKAFFPLVGLFLGAALAIVDQALSRTSAPLVRDVLLVAGAGDPDRAAPPGRRRRHLRRPLRGRTARARLEIMRDPRAGRTASWRSCCCSPSRSRRSAACRRRCAPALILAPCLGRWGIVLATYSSPTPGPKGWARLQGVDPAGTSWSPGAIALGAAGLVGVLAAGLDRRARWPSCSLSQWVAGRLGGLSGDVYGAICEITETGVLVIFGVQVGACCDDGPGQRSGGPPHG